MDNTKEVQIIRIVNLFDIIICVFYFLHIILGKMYYNSYDPLVITYKGILSLWMNR